MLHYTAPDRLLAQALKRQSFDARGSALMRTFMWICFAMGVLLAVSAFVSARVDGARLAQLEAEKEDHDQQLRAAEQKAVDRGKDADRSNEHLEKQRAKANEQSRELEKAKADLSAARNKLRDVRVTLASLQEAIATKESMELQKLVREDRKDELEQIVKRMKNYVQEAIHTVSE